MHIFSWRFRHTAAQTSPLLALKLVNKSILDLSNESLLTIFHRQTRQQAPKGLFHLYRVMIGPYSVSTLIMSFF